MNPWLLVVLVGTAGAAGAVARFLVAELAARLWSGRLPIATLVINVSGAFALGLLLTAGGPANTALFTLRVVLGTGFLGGYTTFSTFAHEAHTLQRQGRARHATLYTSLSLLLGVVSAALGIALGGLLHT